MSTFQIWKLRFKEFKWASLIAQLVKNLPAMQETQVRFRGWESSSHLIFCCPLLLLPPIPPSIRVFSNDSTLLMRWPKYWSFRFNISPSNEHPGLISFRMDWLDIRAVQGSVPSLHGKWMGKQWKQWLTLFWRAPKSLQMVTAAMKLKDAYSLEGKL